LTETETSPPADPAKDIVPATANGGAADEKRADKPREVEIKFAANAEGLAAALASPLLSGAESAPGRQLTSIYFDTPGWDLQNSRMALRVRSTDRGAPIMTLKWQPEAAEGVFVRGEIETPVAGLEPDLSLFDAAMGEKLRALIGENPLEAKYETRVWRVARMVDQSGAAIEAAFDEGVILVGERSRPLCEVELELKSGEPRQFYEFAALVVEQSPLVLDMVSKAQRAFHFAVGTAPAPVKMRPVALPDEVILDEALSQIILGCCSHFTANWAALREGDDPEAIHQMRVALRRLRAALAMFKHAIPCAEFQAFRTEAGDLATAMGPARDCDALRELIEIGPMAHFGEAKDFSSLLDALEARRRAAYTEARALLASKRPTIFVLKLSAFVARRGWRNALSAEQLAILTEPVGIFAAQALDRLYKRVLKRGKNLAALPDAARHQARIALKNLRYGAEFFAPCFAEARTVHPFLRATAQLQTVLGAHNDAASADQFLSGRHESEAARAAGLVTGWYARGAIIADERLARDWKDFRRIKPFWR
jgi:inorganic triphosphatase YgiF